MHEGGCLWIMKHKCFIYLLLNNELLLVLYQLLCFHFLGFFFCFDFNNELLLVLYQITVFPPHLAAKS